MSADVLREAAALVRERAQAATPSPWAVVPDAHPLSRANGPHVRHKTPAYSTSVVTHVWEGNAPHIASWHPAAALAVADWLDAEAEDAQEADIPPHPDAVAVARTYLGRVS